MLTVTLTKEELLWGKHIGETRYSESRKKNLKNKIPGGYSEYDTLGALGEIAAAKALGISLNEIEGTFKGADLGFNLQVRTTEHARGHLIIRKGDNPKQGDNPKHAYILVRCPNQPVFEIVGWCFGFEAEGLGRQGTGGLWVNESKLRPPKDLYTHPDTRANFYNF